MNIHDNSAFVNDLRVTVNYIGIDSLVALLRSSPDGAGIDSTLLDKLVELVTMLAEGQELQYSPIPKSAIVGAANNTEVPYVRVEGLKEMPYTLVVESKEADDDSVGDSDGQSHVDDEVIISREAFPELFPTKEITEKKLLLKSFPNLNEFRGGIHHLGSGNFGLTFKSVLRGVPVVLKVSKQRSEEANRADYHEWSVSERLDAHPNVLQIIGLCPAFAHPFFGGVGTTALITPLKENGGLGDFFKKRTYRRRDIMDIAFGMIAGIRSLHEQRVVHRDIAVRNFLVDSDGRVLICDFGLTEFLPKGRDVFHGPPGEMLPWRHLAPESFSRVFSTKSDIWMYGLALVELLSEKPLWPAINTCDDLKKCFEKKDITRPDMEKFPPVIAAIVADCLQFDPAARPTADDIAERLVKSQFEEEDRDRDENGNTRLHRALMEDIVWNLKYRETMPRLINAVNHHGESPLMLAKDDGSRRALLSLFRRVPDCNAEPSRIPEYFHNIDVFGTFLKLAHKEDVEGIKSLGKLGIRDILSKINGRMRDQQCGTPLHVAAKTGNTELLDSLINLSVFDACDTDRLGQTALHVASACGHVGVIETLLALDEPLASKNYVPVCVDVEEESHYLVNVQDNDGKTALHLAALNSHVSAASALLRNKRTKVNVRDSNERIALFDSILGSNASRNEQLDMLQRFIDHPSVDINARDSSGETVLHKLAHEDFARAVSILLQRTDVKASEREHEHGYTPLLLATRELSVDVVGLLCTREDVSVNEPDKYGNSPLHLLAKAPALSFKTNRQPNSSKLNIGTQIVRKLLSQADVLVNIHGVGKNTPLHDAIQRENLVIAMELLSRAEVDANARNARGETPLRCAVRSDNDKLAKLLLSRDDVDTNARDKSQETPLHKAAYDNSVSVAKILLSRDEVDANARDKHQRTPLHMAAHQNSVEIGRLLLLRDDIDAGARDERQRTPLHVAAYRNSVEVAKMLLSRHDIDADARDESQQTPLHIAARSNSVEVAKLLLLRNDVDANASNCREQTPLHLAASKNIVAATQLLLSRDDVDANARNWREQTPLHVAAYKDGAEVVKVLLLRDDVDTNARDEDQQTPLHLAANENSVDFAKVLLVRDDVDVNVRDWHQRTPLHRAADGNSVGVAKILLSRGDVDTNARDKYQQTPLHCAAYKNSFEVAKVLLSRDDVDADARDENQQTPFHIAAFWCSVEVAKILLSRDDVDPNARDKDQETPLHIAARAGHLRGLTGDLLKLLTYDRRVDFDARNAHGKTAREIASTRDH